MRAKHLLACTALLIPAALLSCDDSREPTAPVDQATADGIDAPSLTTVGFGSKWHDPHIKGPKVRTFTNNYTGEVISTARVCEADEKRFGSQDGAELRVSLANIDVIPLELTSEEDFCDAGVYPVDQKIRGKKVGQVKELDFSYAGGGVFGAPSMRIPIDECSEVSPDVSTASTPTRQPCGNLSFMFTDGIMEEYAYIDAETCHDGDANVGTVEGEDADHCLVRYHGTVYDNWADFVETHPDYRIAKKAVDFTGVAAAVTELPLVDARTSVVISPFLHIAEQQVPEPRNSHYLVWMVDVR